jgi:hypothetical protein
VEDDKQVEHANSDEGASPADDIRKQNPGETTTQNLAGRGGPQPETGRTGGGESGGGPYANPHSGKAPKDGFLGHGGQTEIDQKPRPGEPKEAG